jgi:hypothetical protein
MDYMTLYPRSQNSSECCKTSELPCTHDSKQWLKQGSTVQYSDFCTGESHDQQYMGYNWPGNEVTILPDIWSTVKWTV